MPFSFGDWSFGEWLFAQHCDFIISAASYSQFPDAALPEVAFAGRSNVGKSSLINALTGRKSLARVSNTPGRTQQINFFTLGEWLMLADLPGYGYARAPKETVQQWTRLVKAYLKGRQALRRTCLLVDARHGLKDVDRSIMDLLDEAAQSYQVTLTKCDKIKNLDLTDLLARTSKELAARPAAHPEIIATSAKTGIGVQDLRAALADFVPENAINAIQASNKKLEIKP